LIGVIFILLVGLIGTALKIENAIAVNMLMFVPPLPSPSHWGSLIGELIFATIVLFFGSFTYRRLDEPFKIELRIFTIGININFF
jgi:hypothetical protein